jgi:hypothetical protein
MGYRLALVLMLLAAAGCAEEKPAESSPLGIILRDDGIIYAGVASVDITPDIGETFTDLDGNHDFDGCIDDPEAAGEDCDEPFDDANGNGEFDPVWIGGFGPKRPALGVHDPIYARAVVIAYDGSYMAFVALDLVGLGSPRIHEARDRLAAEGFEPNRLLVASSHNHQGPDTMGLWGDPEAFISGLDEDYQAGLADAIEAVVREAASSMEPVTLQVGAVQMRDQSPKWFNGANFGGKNPSEIMHGLIYDGRDPVVVSDQLLVLQGHATDGVLFTLTNWSGHPEVRSSSNNLISSDYVGTLREVLEGQFGGMAMHLPECLGGMQSALNGDVPLVAEDGEHQFQTCDAAAIADAEDTECFGLDEGAARLDEDGDAVPVWAEEDSWEFVDSLGWHIAEAAMVALDEGERYEEAAIRVEAETFQLPVENQVYNLLAPFDIFELGLDTAVTDPALCPDLNEVETTVGCIEVQTSRIRLGPVGFTAVPGELLPELAWGLPEMDSRWQAEATDPTQRGRDAGAVFFPQHDPNCNDVDYAVCQEAMTLDDCDCLRVHAWPYTLSYAEGQRPLLEAWDGSGVAYRAAIGMADNYLSYIIPEPDFNASVSLLTDDGDHYEDTVSPARDFATRVQEAQSRIDARW